MFHKSSSLVSSYTKTWIRIGKVFICSAYVLKFGDCRWRVRETPIRLDSYKPMVQRTFPHIWAASTREATWFGLLDFFRLEFHQRRLCRVVKALNTIPVDETENLNDRQNMLECNCHRKLGKFTLSSTNIQVQVEASQLDRCSSRMGLTTRYLYASRPGPNPVECISSHCVFHGAAPADAAHY